MTSAHTPTFTETVIRRQFPHWTAALARKLPAVRASTVVIVGCGTSFYLAQVIACAFNGHGQAALGAEWARRPECYLANTDGILVTGLSRSGTRSETLQAIETSRARGWRTLAVSCGPDSTILRAADQALYLPTDPQEGIVMSVSASLMLLAGCGWRGFCCTRRSLRQPERLWVRLRQGLWAC